jgi:hypothetical protein
MATTVRLVGTDQAAGVPRDAGRQGLGCEGLNDQAGHSDVNRSDSVPGWAWCVVCGSPDYVELERNADNITRTQLDTAAVASQIGVTTESFRRMKARPGFAPEPDGYVGRSPWWWSATIDRWDKKRPGRGRPSNASKKEKEKVA